MTVKIIAEIGVNHNGSTELARKLIDRAKHCGADMVKFQTFSADRLAAQTTPKVPYQCLTSDPKESHFEMLKKLELSHPAHVELKEYCRKKGIEFCSTPYSREDAEFLYKLGVRVFKIASADIVDRMLHEFIAGTHCQSIISTGMATLDEIVEVLSIYNNYNAKKNVVLLQCTSAYPANAKDANLLVMKMLKEKFGTPIGYSDHTQGNECSIAAVALGAEIIEKHFTLDKTLPGPDHAASATPEEFESLVLAVRLVEQALGDGVKRVVECEKSMRNVSRKSIVASHKLTEGHILSIKDISFQRPGSGISPMRYQEILGKKLIRDIPVGEQINQEDYLTT